LLERFESIYHAQIFLIDGSYAVLKASTGEAGEQLFARGHRLSVGSLSVIGQVTQQNQTIIARDTATSEVHRRNEFLQETRAELAIPMRLGITGDRCTWMFKVNCVTHLMKTLLQFLKRLTIANCYCD
jgi:hypothetical protein